MDHFETCIVGAGVVGLAIARKLALINPQNANSVLLLEQHASPGQETSSRNSEVIHAGIYYPPGSLKAQLCVSGRNLLYKFCEEYAIPFRRTGKLIVADEEEFSALSALQENARKNGVDSLQYLDRSALQKMEPQVVAAHALYSPDTGIVDSHALMQSLLLQAQASNACFAPRSFVERIEVTAQGFVLDVSCGFDAQRENYRFSCSNLINSAGLHAAELASRIDGLLSQYIPRVHFCKGSYFSLRGKSPFSHLIYPLPHKEQHGLGIHATLDLSGQVRFGPDVEYISAYDYSVKPARRASFVAAIQRYYPAIREEDLLPAYAGIRPKLQAADEGFRDFVLQDSAAHEVPGLIQLFGIESPGLTAALSIADRVEQLLRHTER